MRLSSPTPSGERVLVLLPPGPDLDLARSVLELAGLEAFFCTDVAELCREFQAGAGAALLAEEVLDPPALHALVLTLEQQEVWSDFPLVVFFRAVGQTTRTSLRMLAMLEPLGNVTVLERPVRTMTLVSALQSALRARRRQYEVRDLLRQREEAVRDSDEFLTLLAHELRNPLSAVRSAVHVLDQVGARTTMAVEQRAVIARQADRLACLVDGVLEVHRLISRRVCLQRRPVDLAELLGQALRGVAADARFEAAGPVPIEGDSERLAQVFHHLFTEAAHHGGGLSVSVSREGGEAVTRVRLAGVEWPRGGGPSVPAGLAEVLRLLDQPRGPLAVALLLVRNLVELHGGDVAGAGPDDELAVRLPLRGGAVRQAPAAMKAGAPPAAKRRVLVAEDNRDSRESLRLMLQLWGHAVETAEDGRQAVWKALSVRPEVALIDIGLPGMDGYEVPRQLRAALGGRAFLIAVTGYGEPHDRRRALEAGFDTHLVKPLAPEALRELLARPGELR